MVSNRKILLNILVKHRQFYLISNRCITNSRIIFDENELHLDAKPKRKISVVKRKLFTNKQSTVVEWKSASNVIKRLNLEYKYLYGPVQASKTSPPKAKPIVFSDNIIQHETRIPVIDPSIDHTRWSKEQKPDLNSILTFPLVNKCDYPTSKISDLNFLRKHLEFLCKDSAVPSVSSILQSTMPKDRKEILDKWKQNMISQLGEEGFQKYQTEMFANGVSLHHSICSFLVSTSESELYIKEENRGHWESLKRILPNITNVKLIEEFVAHPFLHYRGIVDCFAKYKDCLVVIDWKTSKKSKANIKSTYDDPLQIAAYVGALNFDPKYQYLASKGLIIVAYENGMPATSHFLDECTMKNYWNAWLQRVKQFWEMRISEKGIP